MTPKNGFVLDGATAHAAMSTYGLGSQIQILQEELAEALVAASHFRRGRMGAREELMEELADVLIVVDQMRSLPGFAQDMDDIAALKARRLALKISGDSGEGGK